ncbi:hypothetical protein [Caulobacter sp. RHG1]|uniref:hypothetical protein n=1 Tax=Caulobacter sp. (strain RHG1) TaxID=2545762 RepID=UPI0015577EB8|nr:hypothetical protein [Caulobacter sp. RHG1]NQE61525.1 hypothetical protein [Caulobacter sp. RHG1]
MTRKRPRLPTTPLDLYDYEDYSAKRPQNNSPKPLPRPRASRVSIRVADNWPDAVPISLREIQLTEAYLEKVLAELLGPLP